jgi:hypothetical protein
VRAVVLGRLGHPLEGVEPVDVAVVHAELLKGQHHREQRPTAPDAALDERPGHVARDAVADRLDGRLQPQRPGHRVRERALDDRAVAGVDLAEVRRGRLGAPAAQAAQGGVDESWAHGAGG